MTPPFSVLTNGVGELRFGVFPRNQTRYVSDRLSVSLSMMPLRAHGRNGNNGNLDGKTNSHGDEDSSNSDGDSSLCKLQT